MAPGARDAARSALAHAEGLASRRLGAAVLFVCGLVGYAIDGVAWPLTAGRDLDEYLLFSLQAFDADTLLPWSMLFRTPGTPLVVGPLLDLFGGALAEPVAAVLYAGSIVAWAAAARTWGPRAALAVAAVLLFYPGYAAMFHELGSELVMARRLRALGLPLHARVGAPDARPLRRGRRRRRARHARPARERRPARARALPARARRARGANRLRWAGAFAAAAALPLLAWTLHNGLRYDEWGLARGGKAVIPLYRALLFDRIVEPDNGPASRRLAPAVEEHLVTREPYRSYGITTRQVFEEASARVHEDLYTLSDEVFGWDEDYATLREAGVEGVKAHPGAYASGVLDTVWQQLSEPYYRVVGDAAPPSRRPRTRRRAFRRRARASSSRAGRTSGSSGPTTRSGRSGPRRRPSASSSTGPPTGRASTSSSAAGTSCSRRCPTAAATRRSRCG